MATQRAVHFLERDNIYFAYRPKVEEQAARLIVIGQKRLPAVSGRGDRKAWGFVEEVSSRPEDVEDELDPRRYFTKTRGERRQPAARPAGEGVYAIARHNSHTHLGYVLELPEKPGEVQRALNIGEDGNPPDVLDHEGAEIVLIGAKRSLTALGLRLEPRRETEATADIFTELRMETSLHPVGPLLEGTWE